MDFIRVTWYTIKRKCNDGSDMHFSAVLMSRTHSNNTKGRYLQMINMLTMRKKLVDLLAAIDIREKLCEEKKKRVLIILCIVAAVLAVAAIAIAVYRFFTPDYLEDFEDDLDEDFEDYFEDESEK